MFTLRMQTGVEMSDLIDRQKAIDILKSMMQDCFPEDEEELDAVVTTVREIPSAEPECQEFEWCHDCKEYDQEKHCCHRWTKVIRQTVEEVKAQYVLEYPEIVHCEDCKFYTSMNRKLKTGICSLTAHHLGDEGFCSDAERRKQ